MSVSLSKCIEAVATTLMPGEEIVRIRLCEPQPESHADYLTRYKVDMAITSASGNQVDNLRCVVVLVSSNTGVAKIDPLQQCALVPDVIGL
jgi:hypothetical protein